MSFFKKIFLFIIGLLSTICCCGENNNLSESYDFYDNDIYKFKYSQLIAPSLLISAGVLGFKNKKINNHLISFKDFINDNHLKKIRVDEYLRYLPVVELYGLNFCGIKGEHQFLDRTIILFNSVLINTMIIQSIKKIAKEERPDFSDNYSFPSGHTALVFMGAEMLRKEYKNVSPWIGISGYLLATSTAYLRVYNNRHWIQDTFAGAGIGILSTNISYYLYPSIHKILPNKFKQNLLLKNTVALPYINCSEFGICANITF